AALKAIDDVEVKAGTTEMAAFWQAPLKNDENVVSYALGVNSGKGIRMSGATDLIEYTVAHAYPYSVLNWYEGYTIDALRFYPSAEATFAIALEVNGVDHEFIVLGQVGEENGYVLSTWNNVKLENPYTIKNGDYIRVKLLCTDVDPTTYPITLDDQVGAMGVSDLYSWNYEGAYSSAMSDGGHAKGNWMIGMLVSNDGTELLPVKGYNVLLDGEEAASLLTVTEFKTEGYNWNDGSTHRIKVNTVYTFDGQDVVKEGKQVVFNVAAGVDNIELDFVNVYPNPATAYINVEGAVEKLALYDMNGRLVAETAANTIDVTALAAGNYLLTISNNGNVRTVKVLVVR
ncbi:MAG: T9SS type A sorting domain-containing protein, partial [Bacteroidaceae bacterium]|nr:T9SS type A sorting domain-containing protein [Bacteroidaceae bacterium]